MRNEELDAELEEMTSAEDFLNFFDVAYEPQVVFVNRLHILQRFHDYLESDGEGPQQGVSWFDYYAGLMRRAYEDFVHSDARTEKVFKVFHDQERKPVFVPLDALTDRG